MLLETIDYSTRTGWPKQASSKDEDWKNAQTIYEFTVKDLDNNDVKLDKYRGKVLIVVNVASKCGFTKPNYQDLNELYAKYHDQGLEILGFPCNQFGHQEPGCEVDIKEFMEKNQVKWDMFAKVDVNGDHAIPLYNWLKSKVKGTLFDMIKWNFTKFLINREGVPVARYAPNTRPMEFKDKIEAELKSQ
jgi:glutathione peroxidase